MTQVTSTGSVTSFATEIAELLIQNETTQSDADRVQRDAARVAYLQDAQNQVDALHAAANAVEEGALLGATFSIASSGCSIGATVDKFDSDDGSSCDTVESGILSSLGKGCSDVAPLVKGLCGDAPQKHEEANAKHFETLAEQAKWQASDAGTEIDKADKLGDKILDIVQSLNQAQDSAANAVIGRI